MQKLLILLSFISFAACLDKIDIIVPKDFKENLVIQGGIYRYKSDALVDVQMRMLADEKSQSRTIRVARTYVENQKGQTMSLEETGDGKYTVYLPEGSAFDFNIGIKIRIVAVTLKNETYMSDFVEMLDGPKIENLKYKVLKKEIYNSAGLVENLNFVEFYIDSKIIDKNERKLLLKYDIINAYKYTDQLDNTPPLKLCYLVQKTDISNVFLFNANFTEADKVETLKVYDKKIDYVFSEGYYCTVIQQAIDEKSFEYFTQINALNNINGTIYDPPAGKIITNIKNVSNPTKEAQGFFIAVTQDTARIYISPQEAGNPKRQCPVPRTEHEICPIPSCCNCLILNGSSLMKPHFWK